MHEVPFQTVILIPSVFIIECHYGFCNMTDDFCEALTSLRDDVLFTRLNLGILDSLFQYSSFRLCSLCGLSALLSLHVSSGLDELNQLEVGNEAFDSSVCVCVFDMDLFLDCERRGGHTLRRLVRESPVEERSFKHFE